MSWPCSTQNSRCEEERGEITRIKLRKRENFLTRTVLLTMYPSPVSPVSPDKRLRRKLCKWSSDLEGVSLPKLCVWNKSLVSILMNNISSLRSGALGRHFLNGNIRNYVTLYTKNQTATVRNFFPFFGPLSSPPLQLSFTAPLLNSPFQSSSLTHLFVLIFQPSFCHSFLTLLCVLPSKTHFYLPFWPFPFSISIISNLYKSSSVTNSLITESWIREFALNIWSIE